MESWAWRIGEWGVDGVSLTFMKDIQMILCTALGKDMEYAGEVI